MTVVILGVDGSTTAVRAAATAARMATALRAELVVACAFGALDVAGLRTGDEEAALSREGNARRIAEEAAAVLATSYPGITITPRPVDGRPAEALVKAAEVYDADLIVVGNRRVQGLARVLAR